YTGRADLAASLLAQLTDDRFVRKIVGVTTTAGTPSLLEQIWHEGITKPQKREPSPRRASPPLPHAPRGSRPAATTTTGAGCSDRRHAGEPSSPTASCRWWARSQTIPIPGWEPHDLLPGQAGRYHLGTGLGGTRT